MFISLVLICVDCFCLILRRWSNSRCKQLFIVTFKKLPLTISSASKGRRMCKRIKAFTQPLGHVGRGLPYQSERRTLHSMFRRGVHHGCSPRGILECGYQWIWLMTKYDLNILYTLKMTLFSMPSRVDCAYGKGPFAGGHVLQCSFHLRLQVWWDVLTQDLSTSHWWPDQAPIITNHNTLW